MNITPTHVTFEQAKLINYPFLTNTGYSFDGNILIREGFIATNGWINRPEQWQVVEWLRVNHGIWIQPTWVNDNTFRCGVIDINNRTEYIINTKEEQLYHISPQAAYSAAFDYILNNNLT